MALKRVINKNNGKYRTCLSCGARLPNNLKDDTKIKCEHCGTEMFVDIYRNAMTLTATSHEYLRRRPTKEEQLELNKVDPAVLENIRKQIQSETEEERNRLRKNAADWEAAAEGLARQIEIMNERNK